MRSSVVVAISLVSLVWLSAIALDVTWLAIAGGISCIAATCVPAIRRRRGTRRRLLTAALAGFLATIAGALGLLLALAPNDGAGLAVQLALIVLLAPVVPVLYAATWTSGEPPG